MNYYAWPASFARTEDAVILTFPDWPGLSEAGDSVGAAILRATDRLSEAVYKRIEARAPIPNPSDLGPRQIPIVIADEVAAQLEGYLEERQARMFREAKEIQQANDNRRMAYLTDYRAAIEPTERTIADHSKSATDFAAIAIRFCYILNAGGLVAIPAIVEILRQGGIAGSPLIWPASAFVAGVLLGAVTNYCAYRAMTAASDAWYHESNARGKEISGAYYPPENLTTHQAEIAEEHVTYERKLASATCWGNSGVLTFCASIFAFLFGVCSAIYGLW